MRISNSNDLGKLLQEKFGGDLIVDKLNQIQISNVPKTTEKEIEAKITNYYVKTLKCTAHPQLLGFENDKGYEVVTLTYTPEPANQILITIIEMNKHPSTPQPSSQQTSSPSTQNQ